jgi:hypothetical protein
MAKGGKFPGAGRPTGSKNKYSIHDFFTEKDVETFIKFLRLNYQNDARLLTWLGDHLFGKAAQPLTGGDGGPIEIKGVTITNATGKGGFGSFWTGMYDAATVPMKTVGGQVLYRVGNKLKFLAEKGVKTFGQFLKSRGYKGHGLRGCP